MDAKQARDSLRKIEEHKRQAVEQVGGAELSWWYVLCLAVALFAAGASNDIPWFNGYGPTDVRQYIPLATVLVVMVVLATLLRRSAGARLHRSHSPKHLTAGVAGIIAACLVVFIVVGTVLRSYDVPFDGTIAAAVGALVFVAGAGLLRRALLARTTDRDPQA